MSKRLQVLIDDNELRAFRKAARRRGLTVSEWVRGTLHEANRQEPQGDIESKLKAIRTAAQHDFPTADIDEMLQDIEQGYVQ